MADENDFRLLYKYRSLSGDNRYYTCRIVAHNKVFYASPRHFNDPFDCLFSINMDGAPLSKTGWSKQDQIKAFGDKWLWDENKDIAIFSLSEVNNDTLMWSHYADCHAGICLQLRVPASNNLYKVQYSETRPQLPFPDVREEHRDQERFQDDIIGILTTKSPHWEYEKEWRCIDFGGSGERPLPIGMLTGIIFGCCTPDADKAMVKEWIEFRARPIDLYHAVKKDAEFALEIIEMECS